MSCYFVVVVGATASSSSSRADMHFVDEFPLGLVWKSDDGSINVRRVMMSASGAAIDLLDGPRTPLNWSHYPHFRWRARVVGSTSSSGSGSIAFNNTSSTTFKISNNGTSVNGSNWSPFVLFDNASVAAAAASYQNHFLLPAHSYPRQAGDTFDFLSFSLVVSGKTTKPSHPPPAPPGRLPPAPKLHMEPCDASNPRQQWDQANFGGWKMRNNSAAGGFCCITNDPRDKPGLRLRCSAAARARIPMKYQQWHYYAKSCHFTSTLLQPQACMAIGTRSTGPNPTVGTLDAVSSTLAFVLACT